MPDWLRGTTKKALQCPKGGRGKGKGSMQVAKTYRTEESNALTLLKLDGSIELSIDDTIGTRRSQEQLRIAWMLAGGH